MGNVQTKALRLIERKGRSGEPFKVNDLREELEILPHSKHSRSPDALQLNSLVSRLLRAEAIAVVGSGRARNRYYQVSDQKALDRFTAKSGNGGPVRRNETTTNGPSAASGGPRRVRELEVRVQALENTVQTMFDEIKQRLEHISQRVDELHDAWS